MAPEGPYRLGRALFMAGTVAALFVGVGVESPPLIALGVVLFVGFFPFSWWLADRVGEPRTDERTDRLAMRAASRAIVVLYVTAMVVWLVGEVFATGGPLPGPFETLATQARTVALWTAASLITSLLAHQIQARRRLRRLEG